MAALLAGLALRYRLAKAQMKKLGGVSEERAKTPEQLGIEEWVLEKLTEGRGAKRTKDGRYYIECKDGKHC